MFREIAYKGYNQVAADEVCAYLDKQQIKYRARVKNPVMFYEYASFVKNKTIVSVKANILTDAQRAELTKIFNSYENYK